MHFVIWLSMIYLSLLLECNPGAMKALRKCYQQCWKDFVMIRMNKWWIRLLNSLVDLPHLVRLQYIHLKFSLTFNQDIFSLHS
ncbi:hypothetical protein CPB86DRAFT_627027 [Serendipita vermifera]|nr:hypothetical protein CPB86DRAFT_627027 [Serendipita vermifera]